MKQLMLKPTIYKYDTCKEFADEFHIEKGDLVITNEYIYEPFFGKMDLECDVIFQENMVQVSLQMIWRRQFIRI